MIIHDIIWIFKISKLDSYCCFATSIGFLLVILTKAGLMVINFLSFLIGQVFFVPLYGWQFLLVSGL